MVDNPQQNGVSKGKLGPQQLDVILRRLEVLQTTPSAAAGLLQRVLSSWRKSTAPTQVQEELAAFISCDPAIAAFLLHAAGSDSDSPPGSVRQAVAMLDVESLAVMAMSMEVLAPPTPRRKDAFDHAEFYRHCQAVAAGCRIIARRLELPVDPQEAWLAGLLHDLGKLALDLCLPKSFRRVLDAARSHQGNLVEYEQHILGVDHGLVGHRLAQQWRLPQALGAAMWLHHQPMGMIPPSSAGAPLIAVVGLADAIARHKNIGFSGNYAFAIPLEEQAKSAGLLAEELDEIAAGMAAEADRCFRLLGLENPWDNQPYVRAMRAVGEQLARANRDQRRATVELAGGAEAFGRLADFTSRLTAQAGVGEVLERIAILFAGVTNTAVAPDRPVAAYCLGDPGEPILAVRYDGTGSPSWRTLTARLPLDQAALQRPGPADRAVSALLAEPRELDLWLDVSNHSHQPLVCASQIIGGVLYPSAPTQPEAAPSAEMREAICGAVALALAIVGGRQRATLLGEQLAAASTVLAETHLALAEAKTLAAIGELAAGAAHEINNPLAVISGRAQLMRDKTAEENDRKTWATIAEQAQRISDIITELMDFASPQPPAQVAIDARAFLDAVTAMFRSGDHPKASSAMVDIEVDEGTPQLWADRKQLEEVLVEAMTNAANAAQTDLRLTLAAEADEINSAVLLTVSDRGPGMDPATVDAAFTPFFSLQPAGRRRGLGLPRAKRYVENNAGRMWLRSRKGEGTRVFIQIPHKPG